ncbi:PiggyBac transposable element-derived protein 4 [Eumeta japonica]|uniref:PiggyBac transposable element-derived protein 4 n=1 Tax=Eumeta variegata TaxID=151549 RepID=A0A4C1VSF6_EUMVA|nr:PiggyBac transposable element-derived protein 4 [Eumeta japonica]
MIAKGHHALRIVEVEFRKLIELISQCSGYKLSSRKTLSENLMSSVHNNVMDEVKKKVQAAPAICLRTDGWTSRNNDSYIAIVAHFIDEETKFHSALLGCINYNERHTSQNLCDFLKNIMAEWNISYKVAAIVSDNAANILSAVRLGEWRSISCFARSLSLAVQEATKEICDVLGRVKNIVEFFNRSTQGKLKLTATQQQMNLPVLKLKQDVQTRWNSTFNMLKRIVQIKDAVIATVAFLRPDLTLNERDWEVIGVLPLLSRFYEITVEISAEKNVTLSKGIIFCNLLKSFLKNPVSNNTKIFAVQSLLKKGMDDRFKDIENLILYAECTILDRGFKNQRAYEIAIQTLRNKIGRVQLSQRENRDTAEAVSTSNVSSIFISSNKNNSVWDEFDQTIRKITKPDNQLAAGIHKMPKNNKKSAIWKYFQRSVNDKEATCKYCNKSLKTSGNTTNLRGHIEKKNTLMLFRNGYSYPFFCKNLHKKKLKLNDVTDTTTQSSESAISHPESTDAVAPFAPLMSVINVDSMDIVNKGASTSGGFEKPQQQLNSAKDVDLSDVEDHVELDDMVPTDSDSDHDIQPIRLPQHHRRSGVILSSDSETEEIPEPVDCFTNFITADMLRKILTHTNEEIEIRSTKYKDKTATIAPTCEEELTALFGLLLLSAAKKDNHLTSLELFDPVFSGTRYISVMSRERFDFLLNCLRFDDKSTRDERKAQDKFAPIREWWEVFIQICRDSYKAGSYLTIDEQLLGFRGRCPFRMYIPSKPNKYGLKILMLCDSKTNYMLNAMPYVGKTETNGDSLGSYYVKTLTENLWGSNRNVTMDNWFTSVPLALELLQAPYKCTIVGTLRANKREIPPELLQIKERPIGSSVFCYDRQCTLVSYKPKNNKNVLLLSTTHSNGTIAASGKPEIIELYNSTKGAVDTFDQMYGRRKPTSRRCFVKNVSEKLTEPWLRKRHAMPTLKRCLKRKIAEVLGETPTIDTPSSSDKVMNLGLKTEIQKKVIKRFDKLEHDSSLALATALDPRFKLIHFKDATAKAKVVNYVNNYVKNMQSMISPAESSDESEKEEKAERQLDIWSYHKQLTHDNMKNKTTQAQDKQNQNFICLYLHPLPQ